MEKLSDRDRVLLGHAHRDPFGGLPVGPHRSSDVDFRDVFGGPPRRHSANHTTRRSRADSIDSHSLRERGAWSAGSSRPCSGSGEKPVFGELSRPARRSHLGDDFFSDIFPGSDSSSSSPRKLDGNPFPSAPGSPVRSPTRPLPPRCEPFVGGSSLPAQLSLSMKLAKGIDHPSFNSPTQHALYKKDVGSPDAFGFPSSPNASMASLTTRVVPVNDELRNDAHAFYRQSPLSRQSSHGLDKSLGATDSAGLSMKVKSQKDPTSLECYVSNKLFHFSIYKWAGKGVTLIMPSNTKEKNINRFRRLPEVVLQAVGLPSYDDKKLTTNIASKSQSEKQNRKSLKDLIVDRNDDADSTIVEEHLPAGSESKFLRSDATEESGAYNDDRKMVPITMHEVQKSEIKILHQLFDGVLDKQGNEDIVRQAEETADLSSGRRNAYDDANTKQQAGRENSMNHVEVISPSIQDVQVSLEEKMPGSSVKGKVKDFIKIFNHETSPKRKGIFQTQGRRSRGKDWVKGKVEDQVSTSATQTVEEVKASSRNSNKPLLDTPITINQILEKTEKPDSRMCSNVHVINDSSSERNGSLGLSSESTPEIIDISVCIVGESHCEDLEGCLAEQLSQDENEHLQIDSHQDQIKISDAKIREWSKGKEGNIRSLLSTLQFVLWPESGWKPVPLVDIIEGASVKRAYQKALLCLHPDKLQQKSAAMHQKYIAERVFDILQEAWDHFNSLSSI